MIAVDTNVLIYACDQADPRRQQTALDLITNTEDGVLLWQVACEFVSASRKLNKQGFTSTHAWNRLAEFRDLLSLVLPSEEILVRRRSFISRGEHRSGMPWFSPRVPKPASRSSTPRTCLGLTTSTAFASLTRSSSGMPESRADGRRLRGAV
jgi:hypothetical protein